MSFVLIITSAVFVLLFNQKVSAIEGLPSCSSGGIYGNGYLSTFTIELDCTNIVKFAHSNNTEANSVDLTKIIYQPNGKRFPPKSATINGSKLSIDFYTDYGSNDRDIYIYAGLLLNNSGASNDQILVSSANILDHNKPMVEPDFYSVSAGYNFSVSATAGVLHNDKDAESVVGDVVLVTGPSFGVLDLKPDGSFTYIPSADFKTSDFFSYSAKDSSGNFNQATVTLRDENPVITANLYNKSVKDSNYAKVGDTIRVDFEANEPVTINVKKIAENDAILHEVDSMHFYIEYMMKGVDAEGPISYEIQVIDSVRNPGHSSAEGGIIFDRTRPEIDLVSSDVQDLDLYKLSYVEKAVVIDNSGEPINLIVSGSYNPNKAGSYILTYNATDMAGNQALKVTRTINVIDQIAAYYSSASEDLKSLGLVSNLKNVNTDNYRNFKGLYVEKIIDGIKIGRITFNNSIDFLGDMEDFLYELVDRLEAEVVGVIGIDLRGVVSDIDCSQLNVTIKFYNLDKLGYTRSSTRDDIYSMITVLNDDGRQIDKSVLDYGSGVYVGCGSMQPDCYSFAINVAHFSKYIIGYNPVKPSINMGDDTAGQSVKSEIALVSDDNVAYDRSGSAAGYSFQDYNNEQESNHESSLRSDNSQEQIKDPRNNNISTNTLNLWQGVVIVLLIIIVGFTVLNYRNKGGKK